MNSMNHHWSRHAWLLLVAAVLLGGTAWADDEMPGRSRYPTVKPVELAQLQAMRPNVIIVDARSHYEYETLHIKGAVNVPLGEQGFVEGVKALRAESSHPIVFYCNGRTCMKSYQAALEAQNSGIVNVYAYDAGIFDWVKAYPDDSVLLGRTPVDPARLLGKDKLQAHTLKPAEFEKRIDDNALILDVRDKFQQEAITLFPMRQHSVPLDNKALQKYVDQARQEGKTLLIYDEAGHQVRWLQYYLESEKVASYYFLAGGAKGYFDLMMGDIVGQNSRQ
ncbi:rhodanese-like domain-containing protein [Sulfurivermis fontis]|uniref:rhodanese-like domain-containing protein n=1 Tax=Sulfurivermis fontis TaxID=1972068 RepID=UPI0018D58F61|nr:rhodanese-like domain-containing protein [Sulfurivermis fontis]